MSAGPNRKVLFVAPVPPPVHGAALAMQYLLTGRVAETFQLFHVDSRFAGDVATLQKVSAGKLLRMVRYAGQITKHCLITRVDGVVLTPTFYFKPFLKDALFIWLCRLLGKKVTAWIHMDFRAMNYAALPAWARWFVRTTLRRCHRVVVPAQRLIAFMPDWISPDRLSAIPNGLPDEAAPVPKRPAQPLRVLYLSNIEDHKGWRTFLTAARDIAKTLPDVTFDLHGAPAFGLTAAEIEEEIARDSAGGRIRWLGPVYGPDKWAALAATDVYCFPSWHEAFPLSILEAMCAGLPIVTTAVGGVPDAVIHEEGGLVVPPRDAAALGQALTRLLHDPGRRAAMGRFNRRRWEAEYTVEAYRDRWTGFLQRWLNPGSPAA